MPTQPCPPATGLSTSHWIEIKNLTKRFHHQPVLQHLSVSLPDGSCCLLVGDNGVGKTTLLRIIAGLTRPTEGTVTVGGIPTMGNPQYRRMIGYLGHQPMFYQDLTAAENLSHYANLYQLANVKVLVSESLDRAGLLEHQHQPVRTLSRGMQQRLSLARAILHNPSILLLDEPHTGLDQSAAQMLDETLAQFQQPGHIILLAAHRPQRLLAIASHIAWLRAGRIDDLIPVERLPDAPELRQYLQEVI